MADKKKGWSKPVVKGPKKKPAAKAPQKPKLTWTGKEWKRVGKPTLRHPSETTPAYKRGAKAEAQRRGMAATRGKAQAERARQKKIVADRDQQALLDAMYNSPAGRRSRERMRKGIG